MLGLSDSVEKMTSTLVFLGDILNVQINLMLSPIFATSFLAMKSGF